MLVLKAWALSLTMEIYAKTSSAAMTEALDSLGDSLDDPAAVRAAVRLSLSGAKDL